MPDAGMSIGFATVSASAASSSYRVAGELVRAARRSPAWMSNADPAALFRVPSKDPGSDAFSARFCKSVVAAGAMAVQTPLPASVSRSTCTALMLVPSSRNSPRPLRVTESVPPPGAGTVPLVSTCAPPGKMVAVTGSPVFSRLLFSVSYRLIDRWTLRFRMSAMTSAPSVRTEPTARVHARHAHLGNIQAHLRTARPAPVLHALEVVQEVAVLAVGVAPPRIVRLRVDRQQTVL